MIKLIEIKKLKNHEKTDQKNLLKVKQLIFKNKYFTNPIIVDRKTLVILDGHHRTEILKILGYKKIPALLVDYNDKRIKVFSRRSRIKINKQKIIKRALTKKLFPYKTSKHLIPNRPANLKIKLTKLV